MSTQKYRTETGKMQFEDDWPGVFIRGDDALGYAAVIRRLFAVPGPLYDGSNHEMFECRSRLAELAALLESCRVKHP
jgi:hypothetical protein